MADFYDPSVQGLFALGSGLLAAGGPQRFPVSVGQAFGQGGLAAIQAMQQARQQQIQLEDSRLRRDLLAQEILKYKSDLANQQASQADINAVDQFAAGSFPGSAPVDTSVPANGMMFGWGPLSPPQQGFNPMQAATGLAEGASTLGVNGISRPGFDLRGGLNVPREAQPRPGPVQFPGIDVMHVTGTSAGAQPGEAALTTADVGVKPTAKPWDLLRDRADQLEGNLAQYKTAAGKKYAIEQADRLRKQADAIEGRYSYKESKIPGVFLDRTGNQFIQERDAGGNIVYKQISSQDALKLKDSQDQKDRELRVQMLMDTGLDRKTAEGIAAGRYAVSSGTGEVMDLANGKIVGGPRSGAGLPPASGGSAISPDVQGSMATGPSAFFGDVANKVLGAFGLPQGSPKTEEAINSLRNLNMATTSLLQAEIPGRPSVYLQGKLEDLTPKPASLLQSDQSAKSKLQLMRNRIAVELSRMNRDILSQPNMYTTKQVTDTRANYGQLSQLLKEYDAILGHWQNPGKATTSMSGVPGKLESDYRAGRITREQFEKQLSDYYYNQSK